MTRDALAGTKFRPDTLQGGAAPSSYAPAARLVHRFGSYGMGPGASVAVMCTDGRVRRARVTGEADTVWSAPAAVRVAGRTVSGLLMADSEPGADNAGADPGGSWRTVYRFFPRTDRRNGGLLPAYRAEGGAA